MSFSIIIPSRTDSNLHACVDAIREMGETCRVIVVDDGLKDRRADCEYVQGVKPFVYARNINRGIAAVSHPSVIVSLNSNGEEIREDWPQDDGVILLNDDTKLKTPMGFTRMVEESMKYPELGVVSAACNNVGNTNQHPRGLGMRTDDRMVCFVAVLIKRTTLKLVGGLDEDFIGYGCEDDSYCLETRMAGLRIGIFDGCFVDHSELVSTFRGGPETGGDFRPNLKRFIAKYGYDNRGLPKEQSPWRELFA